MSKSRTRNRITRSEARAFRKRWKIVNTFEKKELCNIPVDEKVGQLETLMTLAKELDWTMQTEKEARKVEDRWNKLRKAYHA